jgi:hypothetical protein
VRQRRWFLINCDLSTYRRSTRYTAAVPCFKSTATWSLIVKHNRRRSRPDPELEAMTSVLPHLLSRARELLG